MNKTILMLLLCICCKAWGQVDPQVNLSTGTVNFSVPLYTIGDNELKIPLTLSYAGSAIPVSSNGGWVGHNWDISVDGMVTRTIRGLADDYLGTGTDTRVGWLRGDMATRIKNYTFSDDHDPTTCSDELPNWNFLKTFEKQDTEPDIFSVSLPGLSFNFYFDENKDYHVVPYQDVDITYATDPTSGLITSFTIIDDKGVKYLCQDAESMSKTAAPSGSENNYQNRAYQLALGGGSVNYAWRVSKIESPVSGFINFTYDDVQLDGNKMKFQFRDRYNAPLKMRNEWAAITVMSNGYRVKRKVLKQISTRTIKVDFISGIAYDSSYIRLNVIKISETNYVPAVIKSFELQYQEVEYYTDASAEWGKGIRNFLRSVKAAVGATKKTLCLLEYNGEDQYKRPQLPAFDSEEKDDWGFYSEDATMGLLRKAQFELGGYTVFFYEPHTYFDAVESSYQTGAGVRIRKTIVHDGVNTSADRITNYNYENSTGTTSGKLLYRTGRNESVLKVSNITIDASYQNKRYGEIADMVNNGTISGPVDKYFSFKYSEDLGDFESSNLHSAVLYGRVTVRQQAHGYSQYEFDLPAMDGDSPTNDNEWQESFVGIARPSTGTSVCYEKGGVAVGKGQFPYAPNPNYGYARSLIRKVSDFDESGNIVHTVEYEYGKLYKETATRKIRAIKFEDILAYYKNGNSYVENRMFLYGTYHINTDVATVTTKKTERKYDAGLAQPMVFSTVYFYESLQHRNVTRIVETNSDGTQVIARLKYATDFMVSSSTDARTAALGRLVSNHRTSTVVESTSSQLVAGTELFTAGSLYTFKEINSRIYLAEQFAFKSVTGVTDFVPANVQTISGIPTFQFDQNRYRLEKHFLNYDSWGNLQESVGRDRITRAAAWGYDGTVPVISVDNAGISEIGFSDFETVNWVDFSAEGAAYNNYESGRTGIRGLILPAVNTGAKLTRSITNKQSQKYIFSCWIKANNGAGNVTLKFLNGTTELIPAVELPFQSSGEWKYYRATINTASIPGLFKVEITANSKITIDDVVMYPIQTSVLYTAYDFPFGPVAETYGDGTARYYVYDVWGRVKAVKDQNQNVISKFDYQVRP